MKFCFSILDRDYVAEIDYRCTYRGARATGPDYWSGGQPAEAPEFDITIIELREDRHVRPGEQPPPTLEIPTWLENLILEDERLHSDIVDDCEEVVR